MTQMDVLDLQAENKRMKELLKIGFCDKCEGLNCKNCNVAKFVKPEAVETKLKWYKKALWLACKYIFEQDLPGIDDENTQKHKAIKNWANHFIMKAKEEAEK